MDENDNKTFYAEYMTRADGYYIASVYEGKICVEECHPELNDDTDAVKSSVT